MNRTSITCIATIAILAAVQPAFAENVNHGSAGPRGDGTRLVFPKANTVITDTNLKRANVSFTPHYVVPQLNGVPTTSKPPIVPCVKKIFC